MEVGDYLRRAGDDSEKRLCGKKLKKETKVSKEKFGKWGSP